MSSPKIGFLFNQVDDALPPVLSDFSIGFVVTWSDDANSTVFPLDTPVAVNSADPAVLKAAGTGELYKSLLRVNAQLRAFQVSARLVVVRIAAVYGPDGVTVDRVATMAHALGSAAAGTGLYAVLRAPQACNLVPRLGIVPGGLTGLMFYAVSLPVVTAPGTGYTHPVVAFDPPGAAATATVDAQGTIVSLDLTSPGQYPAGTVVTGTITDGQGGPGHGAAFTVTMELLQNPVCALLPVICEALLAHALVAGPGTTVQDALAWRGTLNSQRLIPQDDWEIVETIDGTSDEYLDASARALGQAIACDYEHQGYPFHAWANRPIVDALGVKRPDSFSLTSGPTDGQVLLNAGIGITARGDASDTSIDASGFVSLSVNNASSDGNYDFYNKTRGYDFINLALVKTIRKRLGRTNVTRKGIDAVLNDMTAINVGIQSLPDPGILGFRVGFSPANNTVAGLRQGQFRVYDDTEVPAPICQITIDRGLDADAVQSLLQQLAADGTTGTAS